MSIKPGRNIRNRFHNIWMLICILLIVLMPVILAFGLYFKASLLLSDNSVFSLLFSKDWQPSKQNFGFYSFILSSLWITILSLAICAPVCLLSAIYLTQYARSNVLKLMHPVIDILAGIPSVIYGVWGIIVIVPLIANHIAPLFDVETSGYTIIAGAIVLAIMIIPFVLNILIEVFNTIPEQLTEASLSLGASKWETIKFVLFRKAFPGIISAFGLGLSRAFGETIAVLMVVGNVVKVPKGIFQPGYPLPALIANNYGEMMSIPMYDSALMMAALILFVVVLLFNFASRFAITRFELRI